MPSVRYPIEAAFRLLKYNEADEEWFEFGGQEGKYTEYDEELDKVVTYFASSPCPTCGGTQGYFESDDAVIELCQREKAYSYHPNESFVTTSIIEKLKACGYRIFPYTVNDEERMLNLIQMGVNGIISDEPEKLRKIIQKFYK